MKAQSASYWWKRALTPIRATHRNPAAVVGSPADPGTAVEVGSPAAEGGLAGMLPAAGRTGHCLIRE